MHDSISYTSASASANPENRMLIFSPYRCKVVFSTGEWGIFGRCGGLEALKWVRTYGDVDTSRPSITVGNYCDFSTNIGLLLGGEHFNHRVINAAFSQFPLARMMAEQSGVKLPRSTTRGPIHIGSNVVFSRGCTVRSGVTIGDGAVIGGDSVVTKDVPPYAIVAGNPARVIRMRVPEEYIDDLQRIAWWNWSTSFLAQHIAAIHALEPKEFIDYCKSISPTPPADEGALLVFNMAKEATSKSLSFAGAEIGGRMIPVHQLPPTFMDYIAQMNGAPDKPVEVYPDLFSRSGLSVPA